MRYEYDSLGQLVFEDNELLDATFIYYYDDAGNLTKKNVTRIDTNDPLRPEVSENYIYSYTNASWGDLLTSYGGVTISYDEIGNPINYYNGSYYTFAWEGRQLVSAQKGTYSFGFEYNENGIRTSKTVNGVKTEYYLDGNKIMAEKTGGNITVYVYDESGQVIGMQYHAATAADNSWEVFWFEKNLQGDIVGVYNSFGTKLISYAYDAWGNITVSYSNGGALSVAAKNPFRYRGYYYDTELALYYLNSRYYDANIGRFVNADGQLNDDILGANLFAYCGNNPVNRIDDNGEGWWVFAGAIVGGIIGGVAKIVSNVSTGKKWHKGIIGAAAGGVLSGAMSAATINPLTVGFAGAATESLLNEAASYIPLASQINGQSVTKELTTENLIDSAKTVLSDTAINGTISAVTGKIAGKIVPTNKGWFKPKKFVTSFVGKYARKSTLQTLTQSGMSLLAEDINYSFNQQFKREQQPLVTFFP